MKVFVAKDSFLSCDGQIVEGTLFALMDEYHLPRPTKAFCYEHEIHWGKYFTELDMILKTTELPKTQLKFNGDYAPKRKKAKKK